MKNIWTLEIPGAPDPHNGFENGRPALNFVVGGKSGALLEEIKRIMLSATEILCISSFLLHSKDIVDAVYQAAKNAVRVYIITAIDENLNIFADDDDFSLAKKEDVIKMSRELERISLIRTAAHIHSKFIIADPKIPVKAKAIFLTPNLSQEAFENAEIGYIIHDYSLINDLFHHFCNGFWIECERELVNGKYVPKQNFLLPEKNIDSILVTSKKKTSLRDALVTIISTAESDIFIATYGISDDNAVFSALMDALNQGKKVTILVRLRSKVMDAVIKLAAKGAVILANDNLHAKFVICTVQGKKVAILMTANIEAMGIEYGYETGIRLENDDAYALESIASKWISIFPWKFHEKIVLTKIQQKVKYFDEKSKQLKDYEPPVQKK